MGREISHQRGWKVVTFYLLRFLHDPRPIIVTRGCQAIDVAPVSDSCTSGAQR